MTNSSRFDLVRWDYATRGGDLLECRRVVIAPASYDTVPPAEEKMTRRGVEYLSIYAVEYRYC